MISCIAVITFCFILHVTYSWTSMSGGSMSGVTYASGTIYNAGTMCPNNVNQGYTCDGRNFGDQYLDASVVSSYCSGHSGTSKQFGFGHGVTSAQICGQCAQIRVPRIDGTYNYMTVMMVDHYTWSMEVGTTEIAYLVEGTNWVVGDRADFDFRIVGNWDCYASFDDTASTSSTTTTTSTTNSGGSCTTRCGIDWGDANGKCGECCTSTCSNTGESCYADVSIIPCGNGTPAPTTSTTSTTSASSTSSTSTTSGGDACGVSSNWGSMKISPYWGSTTALITAEIYNPPTEITKFEIKGANDNQYQTCVFQNVNFFQCTISGNALVEPASVKLNDGVYSGINIIESVTGSDIQYPLPACSGSTTTTTTTPAPTTTTTTTSASSTTTTTTPIPTTTTTPAPTTTTTTTTTTSAPTTTATTSTTPVPTTTTTTTTATPVPTTTTTTTHAPTTATTSTTTKIPTTTTKSPTTTTSTTTKTPTTTTTTPAPTTTTTTKSPTTTTATTTKIPTTTTTKIPTTATTKRPTTSTTASTSENGDDGDDDDRENNGCLITNRDGSSAWWYSISVDCGRVEIDMVYLKANRQLSWTKGDYKSWSGGYYVFTANTPYEGPLSFKIRAHSGQEIVSENVLADTSPNQSGRMDTSFSSAYTDGNENENDNGINWTVLFAIIICCLVLIGCIVGGLWWWKAKKRKINAYFKDTNDTKHGATEMIGNSELDKEQMIEIDVQIEEDGQEMITATYD